MIKAKKHVIIVGGGASGIVAAISAKRMGAQVTILERNPRIGKKILATGNGRCNFTNINTNINCYSGKNPQFISNALSLFGVKETIEFFEKLGIAHKVEEQGKVFPMSDQASSILDVLLYELNRMEINIICNAFVKRITRHHETFKIETENQSSYNGDAVIIATGGKAMPSTGSDGNGYRLAENFGHTITHIFPGLVQLKLEGGFFKQIEGVKFVGSAEILHQNQSIAKDRGDILFGNYGVSGPPILQISRKAGELLSQNKEPVLKISIIDSLSKEDLAKLLFKRFQNSKGKTLDFCLVGLINKRLIPVILKEAGFQDLKIPAAKLSSPEQERIAHILTDWRLKIRGTKGWTSAQITAGGINTEEINPLTMESALIPGLFFAGEIIDIDGMCGGYNLQWAWTSGFIAGQNAAF
ncbi:MAG: NAD(P)/FAD-dependent oxidoreductase [Bacillota bacterium]|jgi:predicted Rossmann fold flavoprotein